MSPDSESTYRARTPASERLARQFAGVFPQGVSGAAKHFHPYPVVVAAAQGDTVVDVDGNRYVDVLMGAGPMLLGHGHPAVVEAIRAQAGRMTNPMLPTELSYEYAQRIRGHMPYLERLRFANTGSEATRTALRIARAATGRRMVAKCEGGYHGSDDAFLVSTHSRDLAGTDDRPEPTLDYAGIPAWVVDETVVIPYNDPAAARTLIAEYADELAAVIIEPVAFSSGGGIPASREFAQALREATSDAGAVLIFDEVLCAYRMGLAGAPDYLGVTPDLSTIGKAIGGGLPLAAVGGRASLMDAALGPESGHRRIFQSGTFTENPLSIAAGMAALDVLESEPVLERADATGEAIRTGLAAAFAEAGVEADVTGCCSIFQVHLGAGAVRNRRDVVRANLAATRDFLLGMVAEGVLWPPVHPGVTSGAHSDESVELLLGAARRTLKAHGG